MMSKFCIYKRISFSLLIQLIVILGRLEAVELNCQPPTSSVSSDIIRAAEKQFNQVQSEKLLQDDLDKIVGQDSPLEPWLRRNLQQYKSLTALEKENIKTKLFQSFKDDTSIISKNSSAFFTGIDRSFVTLVLLKIDPSFRNFSDFIPSLDRAQLSSITYIAADAQISLSEDIVVKIFDRLSDLGRGDFFYRQLNTFGKLSPRVRGFAGSSGNYFHVRAPDDLVFFSVSDLLKVSVGETKKKLIRKILNSNIESLQSLGLSNCWLLDDEAEPYLLNALRNNALKNGNEGPNIGRSIAKMKHPSAKLMEELSKSKGFVVTYFLAELPLREPTTADILTVKKFLNGAESSFANIVIVQWAMRSNNPQLKELATEALQIPDVLDYFLRGGDIKELEYIFPLLKDEEAKDKVERSIQKAKTKN
ncbi:MAG: hypothetical protein JWQ35_1254 [Bacteriovoracaceae bacterium]|nr:hypothetical protein [Bacteriovoracaceae bacterium]